MIEKLLEQSALKNGQQVSFILNHKVLTKSGSDWYEVKGDVLTIEEWEDLKDLCLQGNEKVQLETKGYISGIFKSGQHSWKFSFTEKKDCFKAHLSLIREREQLQSYIENPLFWETMKKNRGLFIIAGERRQGKTSLLHEIVYNEQMSRISIVGIHTAVQHLDWEDTGSVMQLGVETIDYDSNHTLYEGVEKVIVDMNSIKNWKKWIEMAEQGQAVMVTLSTNSVKTVFNRIISDLDRQTALRLMNVLNGMIVQKLVGNNLFPCSEILVIKEKQREVLRQLVVTDGSILSINLGQEFKDSYQSLNQSLIQKLIRRKIDVQAAFEASDDPEVLDQMLKKMGL